jgi:hypothetical protein
VPPRFAYWTILIDNAPTAFRARDPQELLPTLNQLKRTNKDVALKWFARGRLWESQQEERDDFERRRRIEPPAAERREQREVRGKDWRPGGQHKDPRARFDKGKKRRDRREERRPEERVAAPPSSDRRPPRFSKGGRFNERPRSGQTPHRSDRRPPGQRFPSNERATHGSASASGGRPRPNKPHGRRPPSRPRDEIRNRSKGKSWGDRPRREERRDQPDRKEQEPPPPRPDRPSDVPTPPQRPEQIVIKPEPPERG